MATYSCDIGFGLSGDVMRTCGGDMSNSTGVWSGSEPTCEGIVDFLLNIGHDWKYAV